MLLRGYGGVTTRPQALIDQPRPVLAGPRRPGARIPPGAPLVDAESRFYGIRCLTKLPTRSMAWVASGKKPQRPM